MDGAFPKLVPKQATLLEDDCETAELKAASGIDHKCKQKWLGRDTITQMTMMMTGMMIRRTTMKRRRTHRTILSLLLLSNSLSSRRKHLRLILRYIRLHLAHHPCWH